MVGDYAREVVDQPLPAADSDNYYYNVNKHDVLVALWKGCGVSYEWDNHEDYGTEKTDDPSFMDEVNEGFFGTYGEAQEYLKENA